ncbi:MAG: RNA polymerase sigma factor [Lachnospiraceae bacterium]|nr:RNA polymerase sigma factor [Lachnospiraceae bacterium]
MTDEQFNACMQRIREKDKNALNEIYVEYNAYIFRTIYGVLNQRENAEDVSVDFFMKLWQVAEQYKEGKGHKGYLATIARNMALDFLRKHKREVLRDEFTDAELAEEEQRPPTRAEEEAADIRLEDMLSKLKPAERQVVSMKVLSEMTFQEIADELGKPLGTVTWWYREGINRLKRCGYE